MIDLSAMRLGRKGLKTDYRTKKLAKYLAKPLPPIPDEADYLSKVTKWPMMLNDELGDCTCAAAGHMIEQWTTYSDPPGIIPADADILTAYEAVSGYQLGQPETDNGAYLLDVLKYWRKTGIGGRKILAFVAVDPQDWDEVRLAIALFGNCYIGLNLPASAQVPPTGVNGRPLWDIDANGDVEPGSWGGHCVPVVAYSRPDICCPISWGQSYDMTKRFLQKYCDEAYAVLSIDWVNKKQQAPSGFDFISLWWDIHSL